MFTTYTGPDARVLDPSVTRPVRTIAFAYRLVGRICMVRPGVVIWKGSWLGSQSCRAICSRIRSIASPGFNSLGW